MKTFLQKLGLSCPIIQAPMAGTAPPKLAAAVCNAGGLGSIAVGATDVHGARMQIQQTRALTDRAFNVNFFCHAPAQHDPVKQSDWLKQLGPIFDQFNTVPPVKLTEIYSTFLTDDAMLQMVLDECPTVISFHFGLPSADKIKALKDKGIILFATAITLNDALDAQAAGIDAIVAQGWEAGGHRGIIDPTSDDTRLGTLALTRILASNLFVPVIAAGGIMDGAGIRAALNVGATCAQLGTAFINTDHSLADDAYRSALQSDAAHNTVMTPVLSGRPARCLANEFTKWDNATDYTDIPDYPIAYDAAKSLIAAAKVAGNPYYGAQWAGQGAPLSRKMPVSELMKILKSELDTST
jgi:nitronate monooxygenase